MNRLLYIFLLAVLGLQLSGCASSGGETREIDAHNVQGMQHVPDELAAMLRDLGYGWIHVKERRC